MKLLADENIDRAIVSSLRVQGHDVLAVQESASGLSGQRVLALACDESRVILTADKDFGELAVRRALHVPGIILLRIRSASRQQYLDLFHLRWRETHLQTRGNLVIIGNDKTRVRPLP